MRRPGKYICAHCGSADVSSDGCATWDIATQEWVLANIYDKADYCNVCNGETRLEWAELVALEDLAEHALGREESTP